MQEMHIDDAQAHSHHSGQSNRDEPIIINKPGSKGIAKKNSMLIFVGLSSFFLAFSALYLLTELGVFASYALMHPFIAGIVAGLSHVVFWKGLLHTLAPKLIVIPSSVLVPSLIVVATLFLLMFFAAAFEILRFNFFKDEYTYFEYFKATLVTGKSLQGERIYYNRADIYHVFMREKGPSEEAVLDEDNDNERQLDPLDEIRDVRYKYQGKKEMTFKRHFIGGDILEALLGGFVVGNLQVQQDQQEQPDVPLMQNASISSEPIQSRLWRADSEVLMPNLFFIYLYAPAKFLMHVWYMLVDIVNWRFSSSKPSVLLKYRKDKNRVPVTFKKEMALAVGALLAMVGYAINALLRPFELILDALVTIEEFLFFLVEGFAKICAFVARGFNFEGRFADDRHETAWPFMALKWIIAFIFEIIEMPFKFFDCLTRLVLFEEPLKRMYSLLTEHRHELRAAIGYYGHEQQQTYQQYNQQIYMHTGGTRGGSYDEHAHAQNDSFQPHQKSNNTSLLNDEAKHDNDVELMTAQSQQQSTLNSNKQQHTPFNSRSTEGDGMDDNMSDHHSEQSQHSQHSQAGTMIINRNEFNDDNQFGVPTVPTQPASPLKSNDLHQQQLSLQQQIEDDEKQQQQQRLNDNQHQDSDRQQSGIQPNQTYQD